MAPCFSWVEETSSVAPPAPLDYILDLDLWSSTWCFRWALWVRQVEATHGWRSPRFYLGHITYISPTTGFVDVWGRCMIWWLSILDGCDKPSWPLLLFDVGAVFCCRGIAGRMCSCRKLSKPQAVDEMAVTCSILVHWSTLGIRNAGSLDSC